ncbi:hypothetical protein BX616_004944 [Lobosporangium transversale]|uniref:C2H2-type domain-containing protein n=1 Tax=Lobosporangium transversale TaxID=64571 RepID=A0A1Y2GHK1_9FUNG|nr:hypothetical protein BCR41DRAFT_397954 [Lobosporangium transversale]KAF9915966.1 hypothetical protein BX616_004944 [Lobosporangium transversale]ORZ11279.1 hypothetical protein BCR41DRAFT_397954 [Lobosporangium transversale]|eukprot:XP_021879594.1 hypothetical protein BCR41DRAFT_397954 [Lobosporangium transversale]
MNPLPPSQLDPFVSAPTATTPILSGLSMPSSLPENLMPSLQGLEQSLGSLAFHDQADGQFLGLSSPGDDDFLFQGELSIDGLFLSTVQFPNLPEIEYDSCELEPQQLQQQQQAHPSSLHCSQRQRQQSQQAHSLQQPIPQLATQIAHQQEHLSQLQFQQQQLHSPRNPSNLSGMLASQATQARQLQMQQQLQIQLQTQMQMQMQMQMLQQQSQQQQQQPQVELLTLEQIHEQFCSQQPIQQQPEPGFLLYKQAIPAEKQQQQQPPTAFDMLRLQSSFIDHHSSPENSAPSSMSEKGHFDFTSGYFTSSPFECSSAGNAANIPGVPSSMAGMNGANGMTSMSDITGMIMGDFIVKPMDALNSLPTIPFTAPTILGGEHGCRQDYGQGQSQSQIQSQNQSKNSLHRKRSFQVKNLNANTITESSASIGVLSSSLPTPTILSSGLLLPSSSSSMLSFKPFSGSISDDSDFAEDLLAEKTNQKRRKRTRKPAKPAEVAKLKPPRVILNCQYPGCKVTCSSHPSLVRHYEAHKWRGKYSPVRCEACLSSLSNEFSVQRHILRSPPGSKCKEMRIYSIMKSETEVESTVRFFPTRPHGKKTVRVNLEKMRSKYLNNNNLNINGSNSNGNNNNTIHYPL